MKASALLVVLVVLALAPTASAAIAVIEVRMEVFHTLRFGPGDDASDCPDESGYQVTDGGAGFRFFERDQGTTFPGAEPGYLATGCLRVTKSVPVPAGLREVSLHFEAEREVASYQVQASADLVQEVHLLAADGSSLHGPHPVFPPGAPSQDMQAIGPIRFLVTSAQVGDRLSIQWVFADEGGTLQGTGTNPLSGQAFAGAVKDAVVQLTIDVPAQQQEVSSQESRDGTLLTTEHHVRVEVPAGSVAGEAPALSAIVASGTSFHGIIVPDGAFLRDVSTPDDGQIIGYGETDTTLELTSRQMKVTVPRSIVQEHGPGTYTFVFRDTDGIEVNPVLVPVAAILLIAPLPFAVLAWMESRAFRKEAFGRYAASARNLQWGVALVLLYYAVVVVSAAVGARIPLMAVWPLELEGWLLYAQVVVAGIAFTVLWLVARELFLIVRPPRAEVE